MRLLCLIVVALALPVAAGAQLTYSSREYWRFYGDSCPLLAEAVSTVEAQLASGSETIFDTGIKFHIDRMADSIQHVEPSDVEPEVHARCEAEVRGALGVLKVAADRKREAAARQDREARAAHEASPEFKRAKQLGFEGVVWLSTLESEFRALGEAKLRRRLVLVDPDCGAHYRATQLVSGYAIYRVHGTRSNACGSDEPAIAVVTPPDRAPSRGAFIDAEASYRFEGIVEGTTLDGFPATFPVLRRLDSR